jgi:hypothetical protein
LWFFYRIEIIIHNSHSKWLREYRHGKICSSWTSCTFIEKKYRKNKKKNTYWRPKMNI